MGKHIVVVGAGISGLTTAHWLAGAGFDVTIVEKEERVGGRIETLGEGGYLADLGANSTLETTPLIRRLLEELGIENEQAYANEKLKNRFVLRDGRLHPLPMSPASLLVTKLFSASAKMRLLKEPWIPPCKADDETVGDFVRRRFGREFLDYAVNPFVAGVYAGNPDDLSVGAAFPRLRELETRYGSVLRGAIAGVRERRGRERGGETSKAAAKLFSFKHGMETLPRALAGRLGGRLRLGWRVSSFRSAQGKGRWTVTLGRGNREDSVTCDALVLSTPPHVSAELVEPTDPGLGESLRRLVCPPVGVVFLGVARDQVGHPLDGFGFLVPEREGRRILGTIFSSTLFPNRAPSGHVALTTFVGGSRQPEVAELDKGAMLSVVRDELRNLIGLAGEPAFAAVKTWRRAIPQYRLGHGRLIEQVERFEAAHPGVFLCSSFRGGIAVGDCIKSAGRTVEQVKNHLA